MSCCTNTYNLGCYDHCGVVSFGTATVGGTYTGVFQAGNLSIKQSVIIAEGDPFMFDLSILNEQSDYMLVIYHDGAQISVTIDEIEYDCFRVKTEILGVSTPSVMPTLCTPMCEEIYDPLQVGADVFDYNNLHTTAVGDGVTITGTGTALDPFVSVGGASFDCADLIGCNISNLTNDSGYLASGDNVSELVNDSGYLTTIIGLNVSLLNNDSGYITNAALAPYLTSATAAATYQPIGSYLTTISGLNISLLNNDSGYITSAALSGYVPTSRNITINGVTQDLSADRTWTISGSAALSAITAATAANTIANGANVQTWNWTGLGTNVRGLVLGGTDILVNGLTIGRGRANGAFNVAIGINALNANTLGSTNVAIGYNSLAANTSGDYNVGIGFEALKTVTTSYSSTAIGSYTLQNATGAGNTAIGYYAGTGTTTGISNTYIGINAGLRNNTGNYNVIVGTALDTGSNRAVNGTVSLGGVYGGLQKNGRSITGDYNVIIGAGAFDIKTSGTNNIALGTLAGALVTTCSNSVFIGSSQASTHATKDNIILLSDGSGNERLMIESDGRVGIGTTSPSTSAKLHVTSTTQGFVLTPMTATQASAITPVEGLELNVSDTNGTFTSIGKWQYIGGAWVKL